MLLDNHERVWRGGFYHVLLAWEGLTTSYLSQVPTVPKGAGPWPLEVGSVPRLVINLGSAVDHLTHLKTRSSLVVYGGGNR